MTAGQNSTGVDINVDSPKSSPVVNAELLGVTALNTGGFASNTGGVIHLGSSMKVMLFGAGLNGAMKVTISGPSDIIIGNIRSITATNGTAGVAFDATVSSGAALGARTVRLQDPTNDITTFTGGLEVLP